MTEGSTLAPQHPHPGLERSAQSVDDALADILRTLQTSRLPHAEELALLFSLSAQGPAAPFRFVPFLTNYLAVERSDVGMTLAEVASYSLALGQLEDSLIKIHDALKWSETKSSLQWWIHRRVAELGLSGLLIVASPGSTRTFEVEGLPRSRKLWSSYRARCLWDRRFWHVRLSSGYSRSPTETGLRRSGTRSVWDTNWAIFDSRKSG